MNVDPEIVLAGENENDPKPISGTGWNVFASSAKSVS